MTEATEIRMDLGFLDDAERILSVFDRMNKQELFKEWEQTVKREHGYDPEFAVYVNVYTDVDASGKVLYGYLIEKDTPCMECDACKVSPLKCTNLYTSSYNYITDREGVIKILWRNAMLEAGYRNIDALTWAWYNLLDRGD
jgi:hypothetical protein